LQQQQQQQQQRQLAAVCLNLHAVAQLAGGSGQAPTELCTLLFDGVLSLLSESGFVKCCCCVLGLSQHFLR
jgi:hypothetical protein